jgi:hypothetical protein
MSQTPVVFSDPALGANNNFTVSNVVVGLDSGTYSYNYNPALEGGLTISAGYWANEGLVFGQLPDGSFDIFQTDGSLVSSIGPYPNSGYNGGFAGWFLSNPIVAQYAATPDLNTGHPAVPVYFNADGILSYGSAPVPSSTNSTLVVTPPIGTGPAMVTVTVEDTNGQLMAGELVTLGSIPTIAVAFGQESGLTNAMGQFTTTAVANEGILNATILATEGNNQAQEQASVMFPPPPPPTPTTTDYTQSQLSALLTNAVSSTGLTHILNHFPNGAVVETASNGPYNPVPVSPDSNGINPDMLILTKDQDTLDTSQWSHLNIIDEIPGALGIYSDAIGHNVSVYLDPQYIGVVGSNYPQVGQIVTVNNLNANTEVFGSNATLDLDSGTIIAKGGNNTFNLQSSNETIDLRLGNSNNNIVNVEQQAEQQATIQGLNSTDITNIAFQLSQAIVTFAETVKGAHITDIALPNGQNVSLNGWHDAVTFAGDPSIHYI